MIAAIVVCAVALIVIAWILTNKKKAQAQVEPPAIASNAEVLELASLDEYELEVVASARRELPIYNVGREDNKIALTIDAAWEDKSTIALLDLFDEKDVKTTWFLCGYWVDDHPDKVEELAKRGHVIGNHSATHPHMSKLSSEQIKGELTQVSTNVTRITGTPTTLFRPPYGEYDDNVVTSARAAGYEVIQWDVDTVDWKESATVDSILNRVLKNVKSGSIILCHNNATHVLEYMPQLIDALKERGFEFVTVPELLLEGEFTIDNNGTMQAKSQAS